MLITVRKEDIKKGKPDRACECPIALAMKRLKLNDPYVWGESAQWGRGLIRFHADLTIRAKKFIRDFDSGKKVRPFTFRLRAGR